MKGYNVKLSEAQQSDLRYLCTLLVNEAVLWEANINGIESPSVFVYTHDENGTYIAPMPVVDDVAYLLERIRDLLTPEPNEALYDQ